MTEIGRHLGEDVTKALPDYTHSLDVIQSVHLLAGGKKKGFDMIRSDSTAARAMVTLGQEFQVSEELNSQCEEFVCALYDKPGKDVNIARYKVFCGSKAESSQLPPSKDARNKHILRANYQAAIWRRATVADAQVPSPHGHGWLVEDQELVIDWMDKDPAPKSLLELVSCACKKGCNSARCSCKKNTLPCTDMCICDTCDNYRDFESPREDESDSEGEHDD